MFYSFIFFFLFIFFSFHFSYLDFNNLNGTIPTQIGLMTSLTKLWEAKTRKININIHEIGINNFFFSFIVGLVKIIWMEQFQLKLGWWLHWHKFCEDKKKMKWKFIKLFIFIFFLWFFFYSSYLYQNNLNGTIPTEIGMMTSLQWMWGRTKKKWNQRL